MYMFTFVYTTVNLCMHMCRYIYTYIHTCTYTRPCACTYAYTWEGGHTKLLLGAVWLASQQVVFGIRNPLQLNMERRSFMKWCDVGCTVTVENCDVLQA